MNRGEENNAIDSALTLLNGIDLSAERAVGETDAAALLDRLSWVKLSPAESVLFLICIDSHSFCFGVQIQSDRCRQIVLAVALRQTRCAAA